MDFEPKTIAEHIECLARMTGANSSFVAQVRALFSNKGISLDSDATPYIRALDEAFTREESIRLSTERARDQIARLQENFNTIGKAYVRQLEQLKRIQSTLQTRSKGLRSTHAEQPGANEVLVPDGHRMHVTHPQRETMPMVPGPKERQ